MNSFNKSNATISQVAAAAGVSMTTVSRYLNGKYEYMSAETKRRIAGVVEKMDYRPSNIARSLKSQESKCIGCVIADIGSPFSSILLKGINEVCHSKGYQVIFSDADNRPDRELRSIRQLLDSRVDGLIVNTTGCNDESLIGLKRRGVPVVLADRCLGKENLLDTVSAENYQITYDCIRHLHENGYSKVAFFTPGNGTVSPRIERYRAYLEAMEQLYRTDGKRFAYETGEDSPAGITEALRRFCGQNPSERLAVFCVNGVTLIRTLEAMRRISLPISRDFGICGFDNWEWASLIPPGITTIAKDSYTIGRKAAEILLERIAGRKEAAPVSIKLKSRLCIRGSTDPGLASLF